MVSGRPVAVPPHPPDRAVRAAGAGACHVRHWCLLQRYAFWLPPSAALESLMLLQCVALAFVPVRPASPALAHFLVPRRLPRPLRLCAAAQLLLHPRCCCHAFSSLRSCSSAHSLPLAPSPTAPWLPLRCLLRPMWSFPSCPSYILLVPSAPSPVRRIRAHLVMCHTLYRTRL